MGHSPHIPPRVFACLLTVVWIVVALAAGDSTPVRVASAAESPFFIDTGIPDKSGSISISRRQYTRITFSIDRRRLVDRIEVFINHEADERPVRLQLTRSAGPDAVPSDVLREKQSAGPTLNEFINVLDAPIVLSPGDYHVVMAPVGSGFGTVAALPTTAPTSVPGVDAYFTPFLVNDDFPAASTWSQIGDEVNSYPGIRVSDTCADAQDCDDGEQCTADSCEQAVCTHARIPTCVETCGNGVIDAGEECDLNGGGFGPCCDPRACQFRALGFVCQRSTTSCTRDGVCNGEGDVCPPGLIEPNDEDCADGDPCTLEDSCSSGVCAPGTRVCGASVKIRNTGPERTLKVRCAGRAAPGEEATCTAAAFIATSNSAAKPTATSDAPTQITKEISQRFRKSGKTSIKLSLNELGRKLLANLVGDTTLEVTVVVKISGVRSAAAPDTVIPLTCSIDLARRGRTVAECNISSRPN